MKKLFQDLTKKNSILVPIYFVQISIYLKNLYAYISDMSGKNSQNNTDYFSKNMS